MTSKEGGMIAEKAGVKHLLLSHLPQYGDHDQLIEEAKEQFKGRTNLAASGFVWEK